MAACRPAALWPRPRRGGGAGTLSEAGPLTFEPPLVGQPGEGEDDWDLPIDIVHRRDLDDPDPAGVFRLDYNFLDYTFRIGERFLNARTYLDQSDVVHVSVSRAELAAPELAPCLRFLQRRFDAISCYEDGGSRLGWVRAGRLA